MPNKLSNSQPVRLESQRLLSENLRLKLVNLQLKTGGDARAKLDVKHGALVIKSTRKHGMRQRVMSRLKDMSGRRAEVNSRLDRYFKVATQGMERQIFEDLATEQFVGKIRKELMKSQVDVHAVLGLVANWQQALGPEEPAATKAAKAQGPSGTDSGGHRPGFDAFADALTNHPAENNARGVLHPEGV